MNGKKAKHLRRKANALAYLFAQDKIFDEETLEKYDYKQVINAVPYRILVMQGFTKVNCVGTRRWFYKQVKKNPNVNYGELMEY